MEENKMKKAMTRTEANDDGWKEINGYTYCKRCANKMGKNVEQEPISQVTWDIRRGMIICAGDLCFRTTFPKTRN